MSDSLDTSLKRFGTELAKAATRIDFSAVLHEIELVIRGSIEENFRVGGRFGTDNPWGGGNQRWEASVRAIRDGGKTLIDTGHLLNSIDVRVWSDGAALYIEISANPIYAAIHNFGGEAGPNHSVVIPARPYLVIQDEDIELIVEILAGAFGR